MMLQQPILDYLASHRMEHLEKLFELLRIPSIANTDDGSCEEAAAWVCSYLTGLGLEARIVPTSGKPNVLGTLHVSDDVSTLLIYGHYDVQPPEPLDLWETPPFEPVVRDGWIYGRGCDDDKGQLFTHMMAIEAYQSTGTDLPVNVKFFIEGEEEIGSPNLEAFVAEYKEELSADAAVISDSAFFAEDVPSITYALRGLAYVELTLTGPNRDVHSGLYGGAVANPVNALSRMIAQMHDSDGRITFPGFYEDVLPLNDQERRCWEALPFDQAEFAADLGLDALSGGEVGYSPLERTWARPSLDCNGIIGGYTGPGSKTIIPSRASAKISMRLVPNQDPRRIVEGFRQFVGEHTPAGLTAELQVNAQAPPVLLRTESPAMTAAKAALTEAFGRQTEMIRCGASVPVTELIQRILGLDTIMMGFGLPSDRLHSPNERFCLENFYRGALAAAAFMQNIPQQH